MACVGKGVNDISNKTLLSFFSLVQERRVNVNKIKIQKMLKQSGFLLLLVSVLCFWCVFIFCLFFSRYSKAAGVYIFLYLAFVKLNRTQTLGGGEAEKRQ